MLDTQTTIFMICMVYLILHGAIWLALQEYRSFQVKLWCGSGIVSGVAVVFLALRGQVHEWLFLYAGQLLMLLGNWGRMVALRIYLQPAPQNLAHRVYLWMNVVYFLLFAYLIEIQQAEWETLMLFNGFYAVLCFDYARIGFQLHRRQTSLGAKLLMAAGLTFSLTLGIRTLGVGLAGPIDDIYAPSWHQAVMVIGQFVAITLSNIAFLRIFLEIAERQKIAVTQELAITSQRAEDMTRSSLNLKQLLQEREEIIRQLSLFNKTAGMGALVASLAHELNQPLTVMQVNLDMIDLVMHENSPASSQDPQVQKAIAGLKKANHRAASIIGTLRNMFVAGQKQITPFDMNDLVKDVLLLNQPAMQRQGIEVQSLFHPEPLTVTGDKSQWQQVLLNLITNASEAFGEAFNGVKRIHVSTSIHENQIWLKVADNGCGIDEAIQPWVFELLRTNKDSGMGIGLWLSKTIVESHQGSIGFETKAQQGTTFTVRLPLQTGPVFY